MTRLLTLFLGVCLVAVSIGGVANRSIEYEIQMLVLRIKEALVGETTGEADDFVIHEKLSGPSECSTIDVLVDSNTLHHRWNSEINEILSEVGDMTGISFNSVYEPVTAPFHRDGFLIFHGTNAELVENLPSPDALGFAGTRSSEDVWLSSEIWLDARPQLDTERNRKITIRHELGHVLGLGHAQDRGNLMSPHVSGNYHGTWGEGDIKGLETLYPNSENCGR